MREMILKAVANPPKILWGPFLPTLLNIGIQFPIMFMFIGLGDVNPLLFVFSIVLVHGAVVLAGTKEPIVDHDSGFWPDPESNHQFICRERR